MQKIRVFFSWQSERAEAAAAVRWALDECCQGLMTEGDVFIEVCDADEGERGTYDIGAAVRKGIDGCDVVVADLTPTSYGADGRANPNANALFEYATAIALKGHERVLAVAEIAGDELRRLPFDFNHNSLVTFSGSGDLALNRKLKTALEKIVRPILYPVLYDATTVFFSQRVAHGFPGDRELVVYDDPIEIARHLDAFFAAPINFGEAVHAEGDPEPLWWFRGGQAEAIPSYERLPNGIVLLGWNELKIRRIAVFSDSARYYKEYLYIEAAAMPPVWGADAPSPERIKQIADDGGYCHEEYAVIRHGDFVQNITAQQYDDGYAEVDGRIIPIRGRATPRCRYLSPFNFIVAAKYGSYNCSEFCRTSQAHFDAMLHGTESLDDFNRYLMTFPKPPYRCRR